MPRIRSPGGDPPTSLVHEDRVLLDFRVTTTSHDVPVGQRWAWLFTVHDGLLRRWEAYVDADDARAALTEPR